MTFIYFRLLNDLFYIISDTFSENIKTRERYNPFSVPVIKIININSSCTIAYAGNRYRALEALRSVHQKHGDVDQTLMHLLDVHRSSKNIEERVDFISFNHRTFCAHIIKDDTCVQQSVGYIGSKDALELFQETRHERLTLATYFGGVKLNDFASRQSNELYASDLSAFSATLCRGGKDFGGFAIPFFVSHHDHRYGSYVENRRGPIDIEHWDVNGGVINFQDKHFGGYQLLFWGKQYFAAYFPFGKIGHCILDSDRFSGECRTLRGIDRI